MSWTGGGVILVFIGLTLWPVVGLLVMDEFLGKAEGDPFRLYTAVAVTYPIHLVLSLILFHSVSGNAAVSTRLFHQPLAAKSAARLSSAWLASSFRSSKESMGYWPGCFNST